MLIFGALVLVVASVFFLFQPIIQGRGAPLRGTGEEPSEAQFQKRVSLLQLRDAEYEFAMGKLGEEDYRALRKEISAEALAAIKAEEAQDESDEFARGSSEIEDEIAEVRARLSGGVFCSECGYPNPAESKFCGECGSPLQVPQTTA